MRHGDYPKATDYARALSSDEAVVEEDNLGSFDVVFLRYNPARESAGRAGAPLIDFAWRLRLGGTLVVNDPEGLRRAGSRMYLGDFPAEKDQLILLAVDHRPQLVAHPPSGYHPAGEVGDAFDVVAGAGSDVVEDNFLGRPAA